MSVDPLERDGLLEGTDPKISTLAGDAGLAAGVGFGAGFGAGLPPGTTIFPWQ